MLTRVLDQSYGTEVRQRLSVLIVARTVANAVFRFAPPFLATIAVGLGVTLERIGVAMAVSELAGLASSLTGAVAERLQRRTAMTVGLVGVAAGALVAASAPGLITLALALMIIGQSKTMFDLGVTAWISDRVPYERRGRVMGLTETAWALGLLVGVAALGLVTAATSWRLAYAAAAVVVLALAATVRRIVAPDPGAHEADARVTPPRGRTVLSRRVAMPALGVFCLMGAAQVLFVTFGTWLKDSFGLSDTGLSVVVFGLGFCELFASLAAARFADRWGKERAAAVGAGIMVPAALILVAAHDLFLPGIVLLVVAIAAFEFAIVSAVPLGTDLVPGAPARGVAILFSVGTLARALVTIPATRFYERHGMAWPALGSALLGCAAVAVMLHLGAVRRRSLVPSPAVS